MIERTSIGVIREIIEKDNKMAFVSGPRQVGKTTLAKHYKERFGQGLYLNRDNVDDLVKSPTPCHCEERSNEAIP